jgi:hypothetical protein
MRLRAGSSLISTKKNSRGQMPPGILLAVRDDFSQKLEELKLASE